MTQGPGERARLEYLRPVLGHIHSGGLRFKGPIGAAFKRQGLMLAQALRRLEERKRLEFPTTNPDGFLLHALSHRSRELQYVAHFREPIVVDAGDIGYVTGNPPQFIRLCNVSDEISDGKFPDPGIQKVRFSPPGRWSTQEVQGIVRWFPDTCTIYRLKMLTIHLGMPLSFVTPMLQNSQTGMCKGLV